jgi:hypothetical protein
VGPTRRWLSEPVRSLGSGRTGWWAALVGFGPLAGLPPFFLFHFFFHFLFSVLNSLINIGICFCSFWTLDFF